MAEYLVGRPRIRNLADLKPRGSMLSMRKGSAVSGSSTARSGVAPRAARGPASDRSSSEGERARGAPRNGEPRSGAAKAIAAALRGAADDGDGGSSESTDATGGAGAKNAMAGMFGAGGAGGGFDLAKVSRIASKMKAKTKSSKKRVVEKKRVREARAKAAAEAGWGADTDPEKERQMRLSEEAMAKKKAASVSANLAQAKLELKYRSRENALKKREAALADEERRLRRLAASVEDEKELLEMVREENDRRVAEARAIKDDAEKLSVQLREKEARLKEQAKLLNRREIKVDEKELMMADTEAAQRARRKVHEKTVESRAEAVNATQAEVERIAKSYEETRALVAAREEQLRELLRQARQRRVITAMWEIKAKNAEKNLVKRTKEMEAERDRYESLAERYETRLAELQHRQDVVQAADAQAKAVEKSASKTADDAGKKRLLAAKRQLRVEKFEKMVHGKADELKARWAELQRREEECDAAVAAARTAEEEAKEAKELHSAVATELRAKLDALSHKEGVLARREATLNNFRFDMEQKYGTEYDAARRKWRKRPSDSTPTAPKEGSNGGSGSGTPARASRVPSGVKLPSVDALTPEPMVKKAPSKDVDAFQLASIGGLDSPAVTSARTKRSSRSGAASSREVEDAGTPRSNGTRGTPRGKAEKWTPPPFRFSMRKPQYYGPDSKG